MFSLTLLAPAAQPALPGGYGWALVKMMLALVVVCVAAYVALRYGLKKLQGRAGRGVGAMRVVERCALASGRNLWIVEAQGRRFLIGESEGGISNLAELDADAPLEDVAEQAAKPSFLDVLKRRPRA